MLTLGITRAFTTRHGAGPLPTHDACLTARLADPGNPWNRWQGDLRVGWLDLVLLHYAARAVGHLDGLAVTWLDHAEKAQVATAYEGHPPLTTPSLPDLDRQEGIHPAPGDGRPGLSERLPRGPAGGPPGNRPRRHRVVWTDAPRSGGQEA